MKKPRHASRMVSCLYRAALALSYSAMLAPFGCEQMSGSGDTADLADLAVAPPSPPDLAPPPAVSKGLSGFVQPGSAHWDPVSRFWFVSNLAAAVAGDGYISRVPFDLDETKLDRTWLTGLNDPRGLRVRNGRLYVVDNDVLLSVDIATKAIVRSAAVPPVLVGGNVLLKDVDLGPDGSAYVSDTPGNRIMKFAQPDTPGNLAAVLAAPSGSNMFNSPTGVLVDGASLITVETNFKMQVRKINLADGMDITTVGSAYGGWDGIEKDGASYLVSDALRARLFQFDAKTGAAMMVHSFGYEGLINAADIGWDASTRRLAAPDTSGNRVFFLTLP